MAKAKAKKKKDAAASRLDEVNSCAILRGFGLRFQSVQIS